MVILEPSAVVHVVITVKWKWENKRKKIHWARLIYWYQNDVHMYAYCLLFEITLIWSLHYDQLKIFITIYMMRIHRYNTNNYRNQNSTAIMLNPLNKDTLIKILAFIPFQAKVKYENLAWNTYSIFLKTILM